MKKEKRVSWLILLSIGILWSFWPAIASAKKEKTRGEGGESLSPLGYDVFLLMDVSGSMRQTDPRGYQKLAAQLFVSLLKVEDRIGIIAFGDGAQILLPLTPEPRKNREKILQAIQRINPRAQFTDLRSAIRLGLQELEKSSRDNRILILMSDGQMDLGSREKEKKALEELSRLWPEFSRGRIKIFSVAFTELADAKFMEDVAQKTGGAFQFAKRPKDLPLGFAAMFEKMKTPEMTPVIDNSFLIDGTVQEAIIMVAKEPGARVEVLDPANRKLAIDEHPPKVQWLASEVFDLITIPEPAAGTWRISLGGKEGGRVFILTNLKLRISPAKNFYEKGEKVPLEVFLEKDGGRVKEKEVLSQLSFWAEVSPPDRKTRKMNLREKGEGKEPGIYCGEWVVDQVGEYQVRVVADGKAFKRERNFQFQGIGGFPKELFLSPTGEKDVPEVPSQEARMPKAEGTEKEKKGDEVENPEKEGNEKEGRPKGNWRPWGVVGFLVGSAVVGGYLLLLGMGIQVGNPWRMRGKKKEPAGSEPGDPKGEKKGEGKERRKGEAKEGIQERKKDEGEEKESGEKVEAKAEEEKKEET